MGNCCHSKEVVSTETKTIQLSENSPGALAIALHSLQTENNTILNFEKGDRLIIENDSDPDWYLARHVSNQSRGFAPKTYLELDTALANEDWFFGDTLRVDAERLLSQPENETGAFMVRNSHITGSYALSVKGPSENPNETLVRHYKIRIVDSGGYFIVSTHIFPTLHALVNFYTGSENGLCHSLRKACRRPLPLAPGPLPDTKDEYEVPFESLKFIRPLGRGQFGEVSYGIWNGIYDVAIKQLTTSGVQSDEFRREVAVMKAINHTKIVRLFAICTEREPFCIVMEYLCNGNLENYLKTKHGKQLRLPSLVNMAAQMENFL